MNLVAYTSMFFCFVIIIGSLFLPMTWANGIIEAELFMFMVIIFIESINDKRISELEVVEK